MTLKSENPIYTMIKALLAKTDRPLTCVDLMENHELRVEATRQAEGLKNPRYELGNVEDLHRAAINRVSDSLGILWRKGELVRYPSTDPKTLSRFSYELAKLGSAPPKPILPPKAPLKGRIPIKINETPDGVEIETDKFVITIKSK